MASKHRKAPRQHHQGSGDAYRWVAKSSKSQKKPKESRGAADISLEEFREEWRPRPDESQPSAHDYYFNSYAHFGIHEDMLKDQARTGSYMKAILHSSDLFEGKTVLDVGSGTGILCLFAAKAGAARCIGIECSDIAEYATAIAAANGLDKVITYIHGKVEEVVLPVEQVDIIVSEWMGYFLIYESMLDSVLFARDKWLRKGGHIFPDHAKLHLAAIEDADYREEKIGFWSHLWGFDFSPLQQSVIQEPISDSVELSSIATTACAVFDIDLHTIRREDLDFQVRYSLRATRQDFLHAFVAWFDVYFQACSPPVVLSTAPGKMFTHWKQTVLYFEESLVVHKGDIISGDLVVRKSEENPRDLDLNISYGHAGKYGSSMKTQRYRLR